jgi:hypothetical protein
LVIIFFFKSYRFSLSKNDFPKKPVPPIICKDNNFL